MKGVLICGGTGSRLKPLTEITNKSPLPVYDKPLICYPLQILLDADIKEIIVITSAEHMEQMTAFLGSGERFGCSFAYKVQDKPGGIAQALGLAEEFIDGDSCCAILGDNIFFEDLSAAIKEFKNGAHVFLKEVSDPERFGVAEIAVSDQPSGGSTGHWPLATGHFAKVLSIEEKPHAPKSHFAVTGCYVYDKHCFENIRALTPSPRGELEITDLSRRYLDQGKLTATILKDEWVDAGTFESLFRAAQIVRERKNTR